MNMKCKMVVLGMITAFACSSHTSVASAQVQTIGVHGSWRVFEGSSNDGTPVCGMSTRGADGKAVIIKYFGGASGFTIQIFKDTWNIPSETRIGLKIKFGNEDPWRVTARGYPQQRRQGGMIEAAIGFEHSGLFLREFRAATSATIEFLDGNEGSWTMDLIGSTAASQTMSGCIRRLGYRANEPTQPFGKNSALSPNVPSFPQISVDDARPVQ